jgi:hypothetical protein
MALRPRPTHDWGFAVDNSIATHPKFVDNRIDRDAGRPVAFVPARRG